MSELKTIRYEKGDDRIVTLVMDDPDSSANTMTPQFLDDYERVVDMLQDDRDDIAGVLLTSAKSTFFAGGNLSTLYRAGPEDAEEFARRNNATKRAMRTFETLGIPTVAVIDGAALGGGLELALACHHRVATSNRRVQVGQPEVTLGLLPGGGGVVRITRMLGVMDGLQKVLMQGQRHRADQALEIGLLDEVVEDVDAAMDAARTFIAENPESVQSFDQPGYRVPGGTPSQESFRQMAPAIGGNVTKQLKGADQHAPRAIAAVAFESLQVPVERAFEIETRYFTELACTSPQSRSMIQAFFFDLQAINKGRSRPDGVEPREVSKVAVLGAGMMGAGIAYQCARVGLDVVLKDVSLENAQTGKDHSERLVARSVERGRVSQEKGQALLDRITPTAGYADCADVDVVIEAVFEDMDLKHRVYAEIEEVVGDDTLLCSNTSTLPITQLAQGVSDPSRFVGLHYFSPVDRMPLIEIIRGEQTSDETLAHAFDLVLTQRKTPIVVNDSRGFYTSRVIGTFLREALAMVGEGISPVLVERAGNRAGYPAPPLQLQDELTLTLPLKIAREYERAAEAAGEEYVEHPGQAVMRRLVEEFGREGRSSGAGFYEYDEDGTRQHLWPGLADAFGGQDTIPMEDAVERMLFAEAIETVRCMDEGVITSFADANIGSIFGIGFPAWTGGAAQYVDQYEGGTTGFVARCKELADRYGERFTAPQSLIEKAERGEPLRPEETRGLR